MKRGGRLGPACAALLFLGILLPRCGAQYSYQQQSSPLRGQGVPANNVSDGIYISVFLDRLLGIDEQAYRFDAVLYTYVTWVDTDGVAQWFYNNIASNCADPSRADYFPDWCNDFQSLCKRFRNATGAAKQEIRDEGTYFLGAPLDVPCNTWNGECMQSLVDKQFVLNLSCIFAGSCCDRLKQHAKRTSLALEVESALVCTADDGTPARTSCDRYCSNQYNVGDCCDGIFIPDINIANIYTLDQGYTITSQLMPQYDYMKEHYGAWMWSVQFHAQYFVRMDFRNFPWDSQQLLIQLQYNHDPQDLNTTSILLPSSSGVLSLRPIHGDDSSGWRVNDVYMEPFNPRPTQLARGKLAPPAVNDPVPLFKTSTTANGQRIVTGLEQVFTSRLNSGNSLLVVIEVQRYSSYFIVNSLVPIILTSCLGFFVFLLDGDDMEKRLGLLVTLFLALTALQFVISTNLPSSSYVLRTQALVMTGYALFTTMALESWLVYFLGTSHIRHERMRAWRRAYKQYIKGEISADAFAHVVSTKGPQRGGDSASGDTTPSTDPAAPNGMEDLEPAALAHITDSQRGKQQADGDALPQHICQPSPRRQRTLLGRLATMRLTSAAAAKVAPIKHDADYAAWLSQKVDRWSLYLLVAAYIAIVIAILVA